MKILYVNTLPTIKNGISNVIFNLFNVLSLQVDVEIGYVSNSYIEDIYIEKLNKLGIKSYILKRTTFKSISYITKLSNIAKNYDIIHVHGNSATLVLEMIAAKIANVKVRIAHSHNTTCTNHLLDRIFHPLFNELCNGRLACGIDAGKWLFHNKKFEIINNGIDTDRFKFDLQKREEIRNLYNCKNKFIIGNIGLLNNQKNQTYLIDIFNKYSKINNNAVLMIIGDGELKEELTNKINKLNLKNKVILTGSVTNPEFFMSALDVIVMPSLYEGLPLTLVEEQANGLSCIVSDCITRESNLTGNVKFISLARDYGEWINAINNESNRMSQKDRTIISKFSIESIVEKGYDIKNTADFLYQYYLKSLSKI